MIILDDLCLIDSETRRIKNATCGDVTQVGGYRYNRQAFATIWAWAQAENEVELAALDDGFDEFLTWELDAPDWLKRFYDRADAGKAWFGAWNMAFDRQVWNSPQSDFPPLRPDMTIDVMAQAVASGLPAKLEHATKWLGVTEKHATGSHLIKLFEPPNGNTPQSRPNDWKAFKAYGKDDVVGMRDVFLTTRQLSWDDWEVYWANEEINDRGFGLDVEFCEAAAELVDFNLKHLNRRINELSEGGIPRVTMAQRILEMSALVLHDEFPEAREALIEKHLVPHDDGTVKRPEKLSLARDKLEKVLALLDDLAKQTTLSGPLQTIHELLTLRHYGGSATPGKFQKALDFAVEVGSAGPRLCGQYVFNGAPQTGRMSSRGVQTHNLTRTHLGKKEERAIESIKEIVNG